MEEEIDLREYINVLIRDWYWIAGLTLVAALAAFVVSSFLPPTYEATAMVVVTQPRYLFQFDPRVENVPFDPTLLSKGYPILATSDQLLQSVADGMDPPLPPQDSSPGGLRKVLTAETAGDPTLIRLTAQSGDPRQASRLANVWAESFVDQLNNVYGGNKDLPLFEAQLAEARTTLEEVDYAVADFRGQYGLGFTDARVSDDEEDPEAVLELGIARRLQAKTDLLTEHEIRADRIRQLLEEARLAALGADDTTSPVILAGLLGDMLRLGLVDAETNPLVQINLGGMDAEASLDALITALEAKQGSTDQAIARLTAEVETLQSELADRQRELDQLLRDRQVAQNTYLTLSNKLQEARIEAQDEAGNTAQLLSRAAVPQQPASPRRLLNTLVAGALGFMLGVFGTFFLEYWRQEVPQPAPDGELSPEQSPVK